VIGIVQVGVQASADRYTYVPLIGIFLIIAWGAPDVLRALGGPRRAEPVRGRYVVAGSMLVALVLLSLMATSRIQSRYWRDDRTLFEHSLEVTENNAEAHNSFGVVLMQRGRVDGAVGHFTEAVRIDPQKPRVRYNLGRALAEQHRFEEAIERYREAIRLEPGLRDAHLLLGVALEELGRTQQAIPCYERALASLKDDEREAIVLRVELGLDYEEMAAQLGKPTADAARMAVKRAIARLAHEMSVHQ
jgi:tetratricopeptide (TPR) repeat protein